MKVEINKFRKKKAMQSLQQRIGSFFEKTNSIYKPLSKIN